MSSFSSKRRRTEFAFPSAFQPYMTIGNASSVSKGGRKYRKTTQKGSKLVKLIKKVIASDAESKEILTSVTNNANATATFVTLLSGTAQGTAYNQRVGLEATHKYIEVSIGITNILLSNTIEITGDYGFWSVVLDRQPNGAAPAFTDIYDNSAGTAAEGTDFRITTTNQDRFKILARNEWSVGCSGILTAGAAPATFVTGAPSYHVKEFIDLSKLGGRDQKINFSGTGATIASIDAGAIFFVWASSLSSVQCNTLLAGQVKWRFSDV